MCSIRVCINLVYLHYPQAIAIGRLKGNEQDGDADDSEVCEMSAHYKVKYGLEGLEQSISRATKRFSKSLDYNQTLTFSLPNLSSDSNGLTGSHEKEDDEMSYMVMHPVSPTASEGVASSLTNMKSSSSIRDRGDSQVSGSSSVGSHDPANNTSHDVTTDHSHPITPSQTVYDDSDDGECVVCVFVQWLCLFVCTFVHLSMYIICVVCICECG